MRQAEAGDGPKTMPRVGRLAGLLPGLVVSLAAALAGAGAAHADEVRVAVATNFLTTLRALEPAFEKATGHDLVTSSGSTGQLYAQIVNGAPFDLLLAADQERPRMLAAEGRGAAEPFTYATGRLALWSPDPARVGADTLTGLGSIDFRWLALAEPEVAPYGLAAEQALRSLGLLPALEPRLVRAQNVAQAFAMAATGNAELGLVALSQALSYTEPASHAVVPAGLHEPIRQDAILLARAADKEAALAFVAFLGSHEAAQLIESFGYAAAATAAAPSR